MLLNQDYWITFPPSCVSCWARKNVLSALCSILWLALVAVGGGARAAEPGKLQLVSSRPDLASGDTVLIQAWDVPKVETAQILLNGAPSPARFRRDDTGRELALVSGARPGTNQIVLRVDGADRARLAFTDYPLSGPMLSGPQQQPWLCQTEIFRLPDGNNLGQAREADCSIPAPVVQYVYLDKAGHLHALTAAQETPPDVAGTTTIDGKTVDFVVRMETGTLNRGIYQIAMLDDPRRPTPASPWRRLPAWNGTLVFTFGGSCGPGYHQGVETGGVLTKLSELGNGYAVASSTLNVWGNTCNTAVSAETVAMVKARFATTYGLPEFTIGEGESGGAKAQLMIADNYPGLLDGILPSIQAGADGVTANPTVLDCSLLVNYFNHKTTSAWSYDQKTAVAGWAGWNNCERQTDQPARSASWHGLYSPNYAVASAHMPMQGIGCAPEIPSAWIYDPTHNPHGARCDLYTNQINIFGETAKGSGKPRRPLDNVGIQYGLAAFNAGLISPAQFVEINERIGGYDEDGGYIDLRMRGDVAAIKIAYATGQVLNGGGGLRTTPIIDLRRYTELGPDIHDRVSSFVTRARLLAANGDAGNHVMYTYPRGQRGPLGGDPVVELAMEQMRSWLRAIRSDESDVDLATKVRRDRPAEVVDACWDETGHKLVEPARYTGTSQCNTLFPSHSNPRLVAGMPLAHDVLKCQLKPINPSDYQQPIDAVLLGRLRKAFPEGVCDYSKPGVGQSGLAGGWFAYRQPGHPQALSAVGTREPGQ